MILSNLYVYKTKFNTILKKYKKCLHPTISNYNGYSMQKKFIGNEEQKKNVSHNKKKYQSIQRYRNEKLMELTDKYIQTIIIYKLSMLEKVKENKNMVEREMEEKTSRGEK